MEKEKKLREMMKMVIFLLSLSFPGRETRERERMKREKKGRTQGSFVSLCLSFL
jgi:hypothetical protein